MDVAVDAAAGGKKRAQARPKGQGLQANRSCSASVRRHPAKLRHSQCSFYAIFIVGFTPGILGATLAQPLDHRIAQIPGHSFLQRSRWENASRFEPLFRVVVSAWEPIRKRHPTLGPKSGMHFPPGATKGKRIPFRASNKDALRYPRSHISANEINRVSPLLAAASRHPCVKPRFDSILLQTRVRYNCL